MLVKVLTGSKRRRNRNRMMVTQRIENNATNKCMSLKLQDFNPHVKISFKNFIKL